MPADDNNNAAAAGAGATGQAAASTATQPDWESDDNPYKKRFAGMQASYQKTHGELETLKGVKFDLEQQVTKVLGERDALSTQLVAANEAKDTATSELVVLKAAGDRQKLIIAEFPDLLQFEVQGLLPDGVGDELKTKLTAFKAAIDARGQAALADFRRGATPPPPDPATPKTSKELLQLAIAAQRAGKMDEYQTLYDQFIQAKAKEEGKQ